MKFLFAIDSECPELLRKAFFDAMSDSSVRRLADEAAQAAARLSEEFGRLAETRQAVLLSEATGASVVDVLRARVDDLRSQRVAVQQGIADFERFNIEQQGRFKDELNRCAKLLLDGPTRIASLGTKLRNYAQDRERMAEKLRSAGLSDPEVQRAGVRPTPSDLDAWKREVGDIERDMKRAQAFIQTGPLFDLDLLKGGLCVIQ